MDLGTTATSPLNNGQRKARMYEQTPVYKATPAQGPLRSRIQPVPSTTPSSESSSSIPSPFSLTPSSSISSKSDTPKFVYPGGRSVARPRTQSSTSAHKFKFGRGRDKDRDEPIPLVPISPTVSAHKRHKFNTVTTSLTSPWADPFSSGRSWYQEDFVKREKRWPVVQPEWLCKQSNISSANPNSFVFPGGRSKAIPKHIPRSNETKVKTQLRKISDPSGNGALNFVEYEEKSKFIGITVKMMKLLPFAPNSHHRQMIYQVIRHTPLWRESPRPDQEGIIVTTPQCQPLTGAAALCPQVPWRLAYDSTTLSQYVCSLCDTLSLVLDLGCGRGYWMIDAATVWKGYGTQIVGFDMVDITRGLAERQGLDNIQFVKGNFLKERLPFESESFDRVRMADLTFCILYTRWVHVLSEVSRVLTIGGPLELIDDQIFFPLAKDVIVPSQGMGLQPSPQPNISIPNSSFSVSPPPISPGSRRSSGDCAFVPYTTEVFYF